MATSSNTQTERTTTWKIDPAHTLVEFTAKHMMITNVRGRFVNVEGSIEVDENSPNDSSVSVELETASIDTGVEQRDQHLRSADFLDVENFPKVTFRSTKVEGASFEPGKSFRVAGDLTIRGTTRGPWPRPVGWRARELQRRHEDRPARLRPHLERRARGGRRAGRKRAEDPRRGSGRSPGVIAP